MGGAGLHPNPETTFGAGAVRGWLCVVCISSVMLGRGVSVCRAVWPLRVRWSRVTLEVCSWVTTGLSCRWLQWLMVKPESKMLLTRILTTCSNCSSSATAVLAKHPSSSAMLTTPSPQPSSAPWVLTLRWRQSTATRSEWSCRFGWVLGILGRSVPRADSFACTKAGRWGQFRTSEFYDIRHQCYCVSGPWPIPCWFYTVLLSSGNSGVSAA